jgi:hypothetical protein
MVSDAHKKPVFSSIFLFFFQIGLKQRAEFSRTLKRGASAIYNLQDWMGGDFYYGNYTNSSKHLGLNYIFLISINDKARDLALKIHRLGKPGI